MRQSQLCDSIPAKAAHLFVHSFNAYGDDIKMYLRGNVYYESIGIHLNDNKIIE